MPYKPLYELLPELARRETRNFIVPTGGGGQPLPAGRYALIEMFCDEDGCDCRRVFIYVESSFRSGPEAVIAWGWESRDFYARWMGDADDLVLDALKGPDLNLTSPRTELAVPLLALVRDLLATDSQYVARIREHYRLFREHVERVGGSACLDDGEERGGSRRPPRR